MWASESSCPVDGMPHLRNPLCSSLQYQRCSPLRDHSPWGENHRSLLSRPKKRERGRGSEWRRVDCFPYFLAFFCLSYSAGVISERNGLMPPSWIVTGCLTGRGLVQRPFFPLNPYSLGESLLAPILHSYWIQDGGLIRKWALARPKYACSNTETITLNSSPLCLWHAALHILSIANTNSDPQNWRFYSGENVCIYESLSKFV